MSGADRDPIFEGLDRLAGLADREVAGDRMPDIRRRVRVARQRRVAAIGVAAVAAVAVGLGVWRVLPVDDKPQPAPQPPAGISQTVHPQVTSVAPGVLDIRVTITGRSSAYTDASGRPVAAGPAVVRLSVDGQEVAGIPASKDASCEPGGEVSTYVARFPTGSASSVFAVPVEGAGEHRVEVRASYCADGEVFESVATVLATTDTAFDVVDETRADLDGDGADESIQLLMPPAGTDADQQVRVTWADGVAQDEPLPNTMLNGASSRGPRPRRRRARRSSCRRERR
ncbi:hypothetical protein [Nocardioides sp.]|uniref:hypothetical protein n=1 Tax=Nocardioides sp. TaxID=35761 RepID=UPI003527AF07